MMSRCLISPSSLSSTVWSPGSNPWTLPLVQLWGWPGSGRTAVLEALLARHGRRAVALPLAAVASEASLRRPRGGARGRRPLAGGQRRAGRRADLPRPSAGCARGSSWCSPPAGGAAVRAPSSAASCRLRSCCWTSGEIAALWNLLTGEIPRRRPPLAAGGDRRLVPAAAAGDRGHRRHWASRRGPRTILEIAVRASLPAPRGAGRLLGGGARARCSTLRRSGPPGRLRGGRLADLLDERGLWVEGPERDRLPRLLAAALERERRRRRPRAPARPLAAAGGGEGAAEAPPLVYVLGLLGSPIARQRDEEGERDLDCRLRRSFQVLAFLASSPGLQAGREEVIEAVWPTEGERTIERNFHPTLSHLRRALEGGNQGKDRPAPLLFRNGVYRLNPEVVWEIDVHRVHPARGRGEGAGRPRRARGRGRRLAAGLEALPRPLPPGVLRRLGHRPPGDLSAPLPGTAARPGRPLRPPGAQRGGDGRLPRRPGGGPVQERIHVEVMRLYAGQGRRDLVRRQYDHLCRILLEELGQAPDARRRRASIIC